MIFFLLFTPVFAKWSSTRALDARLTKTFEARIRRWLAADASRMTGLPGDRLRRVWIVTRIVAGYAHEQVDAAK